MDSRRRRVEWIRGQDAGVDQIMIMAGDAGHRLRRRRFWWHRFQNLCENCESRTSAAKVVAEKFALRPSGVKTPQENAGLMSCLKARPTKLKTFSATSKAVLIPR